MTTQLDAIVTPELRELPITEAGVLRYREAGDGPPLVLLHGSGPGVTGWRNFRGNLDFFAQRFRTIILEFPGYGVSDEFDDPHPMLSAQRAVPLFLDGLGLDRVSIIGNSMGGGVAIDFAMKQPDRVERLVTIGGIGGNVYSPFPGEGIKLLSEFTDNPTRDRLIAWLHSMVYDPALVTEELIQERWVQATDPETLASAQRMYGKTAIDRMVAAQRVSTDPPQWANMRSIQAPTLVTWGRDDRVSPLDMSIIPMRLLPRGEVHIFPDCGHWVMIEQKDAFEATVMSFLTRP
ncbi:alpha/beta fold hydrolase [Gordonia sp. CPCC 205515]|uniref:alpha/beta fold hydrolase n=1 Tax=Gordonia sp. CPCC 205515 TaxID=3140791 RepID=UPI003AF4098F